MLQWIRTHKIQTFRKAVFLLGLFLGTAFLFFKTDLIFAQSIADPSSTLNEGVQIIQQPLGLPATDIRLIIANIIKVALGLLGIILVVLIMYAGYLWMTAGGNDEQIIKSKAILKNAVIGLAIILSAYSIVLFIFKMLGVENRQSVPGIGAPGTQNFIGSGALGHIIKDHYPMRNQTGVPRNTKIIITFRKPISLIGLVSDQSNSGNPDNILGNCKNNMADWRFDCDRVTSTPDYITIKRSDNGEQVRAVAIVAVSSTINNISGVYTIVLKPLTDLDQPNGGYLGSPVEEIGYTVILGKNLKLDATGNPPVFSGVEQKYEWQFKCSTALDIDPPYITSVFPGRDKVEPKNSVIQIDFNEAMDPTGIQGSFNTAAGGEYYYLDGSNIFLKSENSKIPLGNFNLTNGYRTLEFTPTIACGTNACGGTIYCLPVCDKAGANCRQDDYEMLVKAALTISSSTFEAQPFSGVMDVSGNALDGNKNKRVETANNVAFPGNKQPDNDFWRFTIKDEVDLTSPYLTYVYPGLDAQFVVADDPWEMVFSKRMRVEPMYDILIEEQPVQIVPLCKAPRVNLGEEFTTTTMIHCPFLDKVRQYYFPSLDSSIEDVHFNCFYPGKGPNDLATDSSNLKTSFNCNADGTNCCAVTSSTSESFCCNGEVQNASTTQCINHLRSISP